MVQTRGAAARLARAGNDPDLRGEGGEAELQPQPEQPAPEFSAAAMVPTPPQLDHSDPNEQVEVADDTSRFTHIHPPILEPPLPDREVTPASPYLFGQLLGAGAYAARTVRSPGSALTPGAGRRVQAQAQAQALVAQAQAAQAQVETLKAKLAMALAQNGASPPVDPQHPPLRAHPGRPLLPTPTQTQVGEEGNAVEPLRQQSGSRQVNVADSLRQQRLSRRAPPHLASDEQAWEQAPPHGDRGDSPFVEGRASANGPPPAVVHLPQPPAAAAHPPCTTLLWPPPQPVGIRGPPQRVDSTRAASVIDCRSVHSAHPPSHLRAPSSITFGGARGVCATLVFPKAEAGRPPPPQAGGAQMAVVAMMAAQTAPVTTIEIGAPAINRQVGDPRPIPTPYTQTQG